MLKSRSFDIHKNTAALIIAMLYHSEVNIKVSDAGMETVKSNGCRCYNSKTFEWVNEEKPYIGIRHKRTQ